MEYPFFILLGFVVIVSAAGVWHLIDLRKKVRKLYGGVEMSGDDVQGEVIRRLNRLETQLEELQPRLDHAERVANMSAHKIGFIRFNPFHDTGGDNSFVLVLLDAENTGVMISSLFAREGVRIYGKAINRGRSKYQLSEEERSALEETMKKEITYGRT